MEEKNSKKIQEKGLWEKEVQRTREKRAKNKKKRIQYKLKN